MAISGSLVESQEMSIKDFFKPKVTKTAETEEPQIRTSPRKSPKKEEIVIESSPAPVKSKAASKKASPKKQAPVDDDIEMDFDDEIFDELPLDELDDDEDDVVVKSVKKRTVIEDDDEEEEVPSTPVKKSKKSPKTASPKKAATAATSVEPAAEETPKKKFNYYAYMAKKSAAPAAPGSKEIPEGSPNCLEGLAFVFTGELSSISRDDATDLVKRYGARVTTAPSGKTDYVVVGENAGASKLEKIQKLNLKTLDEDGLFDLIRSRRVEKTETTEKNEKNEKAASPKKPIASSPKKPTASTATTSASAAKPTAPLPAEGQTDLWTVRYAPKSPGELIGNHSIYEKLHDWLTTWKSGPPSDFRAVLLSGPPGIGKTSMAHMACRLAGYDVVELNASDTRSKKTLHDQVREVTNNSSLAGFFTKQPQKPQVRLQCIIMDECDGMSAGDRGGMAELIQLIKKTKVPIICACNDRASPKVRSLANYCLDLRFRRPDARQIVPRITEICRKEGLTVDTNTIEELVASTQSDIRQIINLLSTYRLTHSSLSFDESKQLAQGSKKDIEEGPFDALHALLSGQSHSRLSINQKIDLYFVDNGLMPLMMQENYLKSRASSARTVYDPVYGSASPSFMTLAWAAADSISQSDSVDSLIRGYNQEWSLAPLHAIHSCVRPAYFCAGNLSGRVDFAAWLGQNSKQNKYLRILKELTQHLYLNTHANKLTLCLDYAPVMAAKIISNLQRGVEGIDKVIAFMEEYAIAKEDVEPLLEIVMNPDYDVKAYGRLPTPTKTAFTRKYNQGSHMLPYALGTAAPVKRVKVDVAVDEAGDGEEELEADIITDNEDGEEAEDVSKDKNIKMKAASKAKRGGKK